MAFSRRGSCVFAAGGFAIKIEIKGLPSSLPSPNRPAGPGLRHRWLRMLLVYLGVCILLVACVAFWKRNEPRALQQAFGGGLLLSSLWTLVYAAVSAVSARSYARHRREAGVRFREEVPGGTPLWCPRVPLDRTLQVGRITLASSYELHQPGVIGLDHKELIFLPLTLKEMDVFGSVRFRRTPMPMLLMVIGRKSWPRKDIHGVEALPPDGLRMALWGFGRVRIFLRDGFVDFPTNGPKAMARLLREELAKPY